MFLSSSRAKQADAAAQVGRTTAVAALADRCLAVGKSAIAARGGLFRTPSPGEVQAVVAQMNALTALAAAVQQGESIRTLLPALSEAYARVAALPVTHHGLDLAAFQKVRTAEDTAALNADLRSLQYMGKTAQAALAAIERLGVLDLSAWESDRARGTRSNFTVDGTRVETFTTDPTQRRSAEQFVLALHFALTQGKRVTIDSVLGKELNYVRVDGNWVKDFDPRA